MPLSIVNLLHLERYVSKRGIKGVAEDVKTAPKKAENVVTAVFDVGSFIHSNWQLLIIGIVAIIILIKD